MFTSCRTHHRRKGDNTFHKIQLSHLIGILPGRFSKCRFVFFFINLPEHTSGCEKLAIRKAAAYGSNKPVDLRTAK